MLHGAVFRTRFCDHDVDKANLEALYAYTRRCQGLHMKVVRWSINMQTQCVSCIIQGPSGHLGEISRVYSVRIEWLMKLLGIRCGTFVCSVYTAGNIIVGCGLAHSVLEIS